MYQFDSCRAKVELRPFKVESPMWYICAMFIKGLALIGALLAMAQAPVPAPDSRPATDHPTASSATKPAANRQTSPASTSSSAGGNRQATLPPAAANSVPGSAANPATKSDCNGFPCDDQPPHVIVTLPAPVEAPWLWRDRVAWGANLVLVVMGYVGVVLAFFLLKKIERQTRFAEVAAETASNSAQAALLHAQSVVNAERPWLLVTAEPALDVQNSFTVMVTNRGRTPATIAATAEQIKIAIDEAHLPAKPDYGNREPVAPLVPIILLPGESAGIKTFSRDDLRGVCESDEVFKRVEDWEEKLFLYGKVVYRDLIAPEDKQVHETNWCCWYIHGRQKSGLVIAGPPAYNLHT
jgi:hypothetical protein